MADMGLGAAPQVSSARALLGARQGSCCGTAVVLGKDLAGGSRGFLWQGSLQGSSSSGSHLILCTYDLYKDLHATTEVPPEPWFQYGVGTPWGQGWCALLASGKLPRQGSCRGCRSHPCKSLARESTSPSCSLCVSGLGVALVVLCSGIPPLPCLVWPWARL